MTSIHRSFASASALPIATSVILVPTLAAAFGDPYYSGMQRIYDGLVDLCVWLNLIVGLATLVAPAVVVGMRGRKAAANAAWILTWTTGGLALAVFMFLKLAAIPDTGNCLLVVVPMTVLALIGGIAWASMRTDEDEKRP